MSNLKEGDALEIATAAYFQASGYFVRRGVKLSGSAGEADCTDVDVLGLRFNSPLKEERFVADCKDRERPKPFERILWTLGLASFTNASRAIVVTPSPSGHVREFALQGGAEILSSELLGPSLRKTEIFSFGDANFSVASQLAAASHLKSPSSKELFREINKVRQMLVVGNPITSLNRIITTLSRVHVDRSFSSAELQFTRAFSCCDCIAIACVMLQRFCEEFKWSPQKEWASTLVRRLTYGDLPPNKALLLARITLNQSFSDGLPPPQYAEELVGLVQHMMADQDTSKWLAIGVDCALTADPEAILRLEFIPMPNRAAVRDLSLRAISTICYAADIPVMSSLSVPEASIPEVECVGNASPRKQVRPRPRPKSAKLQAATAKLPLDGDG